MRRRTFTNLSTAQGYGWKSSKLHGNKDYPEPWKRSRIIASPDDGVVYVNLDATEAADTLSAAGVLVVDGALAKTEGNDTLATAGGPVVVASLAKTEGDDTLTSAGGPVVAASLTATEAADTLGSAGVTVIDAALARTEADDTLSSAGTVQALGDVTADLSVTEADDTLAATGDAVQDATEERPSGGYGWSNLYEMELRRRLRRKIQLEDDEERIEAVLEAAGVDLPPTVTEAAPDELVRLRGLVSAYARQDLPASRRAERAINYAQEARTKLAYELAVREIAKQLEEEELTVMLLLMAA